MDKIVKLILIGLILLSLGGCWDKVEIEERAFVAAVGFDLFQPDENPQQEENVSGEQERENNRYSITYVFPNLNAIGKNAKSEDSRFVLTSVGANSFETTRQLTTRSNKIIFFAHMDAVIFGEAVSKNPHYMKELLDALDRHNEISRKVILVIAQGTAEEAINIESKLEPITGHYIAGIQEKQGNVARFSKLVMGDIMESLHSNGCALIPRVVPKEQELKMGGAAVIHDYKWVGWLGELENRDAMFLRDRVQSEVVTVEVKGIQIPFLITDSSTKKKVEVKNGQIHADFSIEMEGFIQEFILDTKDSALDEEIIKAIEEAVQKNLKEDIMETAHKIQKEFKADVLGVGDYLNKYEPDIWEDIKDQWAELFPNIEMSVEITAKLRRVGMTR